MTQPVFNIFDALSAWGKTLPTWQHFLLSKLVEEVELSDAVLDEVFSEYLIDQNLAGPDAARVAWDLALPQFKLGAPAVASTLTRMTGVSGVNALTTGETLSFGPKLTVIYGPNGAGKSGYARVLKSACFTRSKDIGILGDVKVVKSKQPKPTAKFSFDDGSTVDFIHQEPCQRMRDGFAVFDSSCVRVHLDGRNTFQVMPYLFDVFPRMVAAFTEVQTKLRDQITRRTPAADKYVIQDSTSEVAIALSALSAKTDLARLNELAVYSEAEAAQLFAIEQKLVELRTTDPKEIVKRNEQRIADLKAVHASIGALTQSVQPSLVQGIAEAASKITVLVEQGAALSAARFGGEPVQPVGTRAWLDLLGAAIIYGEEAYPGAPFPPQMDGARCVLCQQTLDAASADRLTKFYQTATSDVEAQLANTRRTLKSLSQALGNVGLSFFREESAARRTVEELDAALAADIVSHVEGFRTVVGVLADAVAAETPPALSLLACDAVSDRLSAIADRLDQDNVRLRQSDPQVLIDALLLEMQLLKDRQWLAGQYVAMAEAVEDLKWVAKANACLRSLPAIQRDVTSKQKALAKELVAQGFIARFNENCAALRLTLPVQFRFAGEAGTTDRKIEIANAGMTGVDPSQVLSEGEQTAAALADFLTEVELNGACAGVIFDDPVTSMDHVRKEAIAQRLVAEANKRQVIVFTHDILFTNYLATAAQEKGVAFAGRTVWRDDANLPGAIDRLAFPHEHYEGAAHDRAKGHYESARTLTGDPQRDALEKACGSLRTAYEDFIQRRLFHNVVRRWRENIPYTVNQVYFDEAIAARIHDRMVALSRYIDAHSHSEDFHEVPLTVDFVKSELVNFDAIKSDYKKARTEWEKTRPTATTVFN
ncbi:AAA family ATPase [Ralstonia mojiangensis]|uniref:AAA family ATPase n=1 Tax=Ralstonia mojiangensis TaxID=2953895 RepID=UPI002090FCD8|nr:AAA family ATPase [Ralstonia mojiangensis]MCO5410433.1 AAA family ATPase [Ralstonia mojiangensis]